MQGNKLCPFKLYFMAAYKGLHGRIMPENFPRPQEIVFGYCSYQNFYYDNKTHLILSKRLLLHTTGTCIN